MSGRFKNTIKFFKIVLMLLSLTACNQSNGSQPKKENPISKKEAEKSENLDQKEIEKIVKMKSYDFTGNYFGTFNGTEITMQLTNDENSVAGNLIMNGEQAKILATKNNLKFEGNITEDNSQKTYAVSGEWKDNKLYFLMTFPEYDNKTVEIILEKGVNKSVSNSNTNRNQMLVGTWRFTEVLSSGSGSNYMSFSTDYFVKFNADGTFISWTGKSAGGSQNASIESNQSGNTATLKWHTSGKQLVLTDPKIQQSETINYYAENSRIMLSTSKSKRVYQRVQ